MKLNNTTIIFATEEARKNFEGKIEIVEKKVDCPACEIENEKNKKENK
jgi:hypothetical protein